MNKESFLGKEKGEPFIVKDGALIFELFRGSGLEIKNISIASGYLKPNQKAIPHFHESSEEIYYVLSGRGKVRVGEIIENIKKGDAVYVPIKAIHALENTSPTKRMKVLAISSPPYRDNDMFFVNDNKS